MADTKKGRDKQADDEERRQRERELAEARERADEDEPPLDNPGEELGDFDEALESHDFPATSDELIAAYGDREVQSQDGWESVDDVLAPVDDETFDSADEVRNRVQRELNRR